jgi:hypothetical protein
LPVPEGGFEELEVDGMKSDDAVVRENFKAGLLTMDQARAALGLDPLPNGAGNVVGVPFNILWIDPTKLLDQTAASVYVRPETEIAVEANADPNAPPPNQPAAQITSGKQAAFTEPVTDDLRERARAIWRDALGDDDDLASLLDAKPVERV